ncbi:MFS transporter [Tepidiforma sp.]|uniref:MFS transporter n=1 Tax=Tepidiforma sp. TaxID=2682230 RepID=UPI002ADDB66A|nr:MFS transporter [Tepidiforma sp.]
MDGALPRGFRAYPFPLGLAILLVQAALGILLFATFQAWVPRHLGGGDGWGGYLLAAYGAARFLFETPTGAIADRIERRTGLLIGFALMLPAILLMLLVRERHAYLAFAAMLGFATAFLWPATYAIAADLYPPGRRGRVIGFLNLAQLAGFGTGALAGAVLVEQAGAWQFWAALGAVGLAFGAALLGIPAYGRDGRLRPQALARPPLRSVLTGRAWALGGLILLASVALAMLVPAIRPYGERQLGISFARLTVALIPAVAAGALLYIPAGTFADRFGRWRPFAAGQLCLVAGLAVLAATANLPVAMAAATLVFAGNVLAVPAWNAAVMDLAPESHRATLIGLSVALSGLALATGPAIGGLIVGRWGAPAAFLVSAGLATVTSFAIWAYARWQRSFTPAEASRH